MEPGDSLLLANWWKKRLSNSTLFRRCFAPVFALTPSRHGLPENLGVQTKTEWQHGDIGSSGLIFPRDSAPHQG